MTLRPAEGGTQVAYRSDVAVTGRLGRFALGMMKKKAQSLGDAFAANLQQKLQEAEALAPPPAPPLATRVSWWQAFMAWLRGLLRPATPGGH